MGSTTDGQNDDQAHIWAKTKPELIINDDDFYKKRDDWAELRKLAISNMKEAGWISLEGMNPRKLISYTNEIKTLGPEAEKRIYQNLAREHPKDFANFAKDLKNDKHFGFLKNIALDSILLDPDHNKELKNLYHYSAEETEHARRNLAKNPVNATYILSNAERFKYPKNLVNEAANEVPDIAAFSYQYTLKHALGEDYSMKFVGQRVMTGINNFEKFDKQMKHHYLSGAVDYMNYNHAQNDPIRFPLLTKSKSKMDYDLMSDGYTEPYTSTFNKLFDDYFKKLGTEKRDIHEDLKKSSDQEFEFLDRCIKFGKFSKVIDHYDKDQQQELIDKLFNSKENNGLRRALMINEIAKNTKFADIRQSIEEKYIEIYDGLKNGAGRDAEEARDIIGICMSAYYEQNKNTMGDKNRQTFKDMADQYKLDEMKGKNVEDMVDDKNRHFQIHTFYNDPKDPANDGKIYYEQFVTPMLKDTKHWTHVDKVDYLVFKNVLTDEDKKNNLTEMYIYVAKPDKNVVEQKDGVSTYDLPNDKKDGRVIGEMVNDIHAQGGKVSMLVHRGHSTHVDATVDNLPQEVQIFVVGACNGHSDLKDAIVDKSLNAQGPSTFNTGVGAINMKIIDEINNNILHKKNISWDDIWDKTVNTINDDRKYDYIKPGDDYELKVEKKIAEIQKQLDLKYGKDVGQSDKQEKTDQNINDVKKDAQKLGAAFIGIKSLGDVKNISGPIVISDLSSAIELT